MDRRDAQIINQVRAGASLSALGRAFGISCERVRQIVRAAGVRPEPKPTLRERILSSISVMEAGYASPCWIWQPPSDRGGYGEISVRGKNRRAHRISYEVFVGLIPTGRVLDHLCRNTRCVNPDHLEPVTNAENVRRGNLADLSFRRDPITHCPHGHAYTPENSYFCRRGTRSCRTCRRIRSLGGDPASSRKRALA